MLHSDFAFAYRARVRGLVALGPFFFAFMWFVTYQMRGDDRSMYLWIFGCLTVAYCFGAWYYDRFRYHITPEGIRQTPALKSSLLDWSEVVEAQYFDTAVLMLVLCTGKRVLLPLSTIEHSADLLEAIKQYVPANRFRAAAPPSLLHFGRIAPIALPLALSGVLVGLVMGDTTTLLIGLVIGVIGSCYLIVIWKREQRTGITSKSMPVVLWLLLFGPGFLLSQSNATTSGPSLRVMLEFMASATLVMVLTALIAQHTSLVRRNNPPFSKL